MLEVAELKLKANQLTTFLMSRAESNVLKDNRCWIGG